MEQTTPENGQTSPQLAVVVPVHNEAGNIASLIREIRAALDGRLAFEIIYVDDGSSDNTAEALQKEARECDVLRVLRHRVSAGQSAAITTGIRAARSPIIATLDGDGQNDPADIPALLDIYLADGDSGRLMVAGLRAKRRDTWIKRISSKIANAIRAGLLKDNTADTGCGLKVFSRQTFLSFPGFDHMHRYFPALMIRAGGRVRSVPVNHRPRLQGVSNYGTLDRLLVGIFDLVGVMWLQRRASLPEVEELTDGRKP